MNKPPPRVEFVSRKSVPPELEGDLDWLARWMDDVFHIPGLGVRFGLDVIVGLIPGLGDTATSGVSLYILAAASRYGLSRFTILRMAANIALDYVVGSIPLLGDLFDIFWKANRRNIELLRRHAAATPAAERQLQKSDKGFVIAVVIGLVLVLIASVAVSVFLIGWIVSAIVHLRH